jgi:L,D-transpeptidase catalytic domain
VNEQQLRERLAAAIGEPPGAGDAVRRLEAHLDDVVGRPRQAAHPRGMALVAAALGLLLVGGLLATQAARARRAAPSPASTPAPAQQACLGGAPVQLIVIDLTAQRLTAYDHGCALLSTPVTTGGPARPTSTGTFQVLVKRPQWVLKSPSPRGSPLWYPDTTVHDYIAFSDAGDALHSAEWEPIAAYGPGSEDGPYGSKGTVHVPLAALDRLYPWVQTGATVVVNGA